MEKIFNTVFNWLFNENGKIAEGRKCVYYNLDDERSFWEGPKVVELAGYWPYYTDDSPDPSADEINEWCHIEINGDVDDPQVMLEHLKQIVKSDKESVVYDGKEYDVFGETEDGNIVVLKDGNGFVCVDSCETDEIRHMYDLSDDDIKTLYGEISIGSIYLSDYKNSVGLTTNEACAYSEGYLEALCDEHGDDCDEFDTEENFVEYCNYGCVN